MGRHLSSVIIDDDPRYRIPEVSFHQSSGGETLFHKFPPSNDNKSKMADETIIMSDDKKRDAVQAAYWYLEAMFVALDLNRSGEIDVDWLPCRFQLSALAFSYSDRSIDHRSAFLFIFSASAWICELIK